jgi:hypothetical protein
MKAEGLIGDRYFTNTNIAINWPYLTGVTEVRFWGLLSNFQLTFPGINGNPITVFTDPDSSNQTPNFDNPLKRIKVQWDPNYWGQRKLKCIGKKLGFFGLESGTEEKIITLFQPISSNFSLIASKTNPLCNEGVQISGAPGGGTSYNWNTSGGIIDNNWNAGIHISRFTRDGNVPISVTVSNQCYSVTKTINLTVTQPDFGHVTQNNNYVDVPGSLVSLDCQGNFNLSMPWVSNNAVYTWELPGNYYNEQTNIYDKTIISGVNKLNVQGQLPTGSLTDFVGKVTITGVCGVPVVKKFIIRPALRPSVDTEIYSCSNSVLINVNNPTGTMNVNAWVTQSTPLGLQSIITNQTPTSLQFTAPNPGEYSMTIDINGAGGCNTRLYTTVRTGTSGTNNAGWKSGVLSDNRKAPGSNLAVEGIFILQAEMVKFIITTTVLHFKNG